LKDRPIVVTDRLLKMKSKFLPRLCSPKKLSEILTKNQYEIRGPQYPEGGIGEWLAWLGKKNIPILACGKPFSDDLETQDRELISVIQTQQAKHKKIIVWTGSLRLCALKKHLMNRKFSSAVYIQLEAPFHRWRTKRAEGWLKINPHSFFWLTRSPLLPLEMFRTWNLRKGPLISPDELEKKFLYFASTLSKIIQQKRFQPPQALFHPFSINMFQSPQLNSLSRFEKTFLWERIHRGESVVLPNRGVVCLASLEIGHVAEEAAHYVRLWNSREKFFSPYRAIVEEAFAFLGSRWIDPTRKEDFSVEEKGPWSFIHQMGYGLGAHLAERWEESKKSQAQILRLWYVHPSNETKAFELWRELWTLT
jgi:hypothetical protein